MNDLKLITTKRDHLVEIAQKIAEGIDPEFLKQGKETITIRINGSYGSGKSLFFDTAKKHLFGDQKMKPLAKKRQFSIYQGRLDGRKVAIGAADLGDLHYEWHKKRKQHQYGSVKLEFVQNFAPQRDKLKKRLFGTKEPAIEIWIEGQTMPWDSQFKRRLNKAGKKVQKIYKDNGGKEPWILEQLFLLPPRGKVDNWTRYVEISVKDERLKKSKRFQQSWKEICSRKDAVNVNKPGQENPVYLWKR